MRHRRYILSGGGTGGHIYPAIAIADEITHREKSAKILFVGAKDRMEMEKVPISGYKIEGLWISGIERKLSFKNLSFPLKLTDSLMRSRKIIKRFNPDVVIGTGGFASGPLLRVANAKGIPTVLQEQNSYAGVTNKWLAGKASKICVAYEGMDKYFPKEKIYLTGNPVRRDLIDIDSKRQQALELFKLDSDRKTLLVIGGSLGAKVINETIARELEFLIGEDVQLIWQCGDLYHDKYKAYDERPNVNVFRYLNNMDLAYAAADFVISRAGAISISELCLVGKPVLFIPSPNVAEDHQTKNAMALEGNKAAMLVKEKNLEKEFRDTFKAIKDSESLQKKLGENIKKMARPHATVDIVDEIEKLLETN